MPHREDRVLVLAPGSWSTKVTFGLSESLLPPSHAIPTRVFYAGGRYMLQANEGATNEEIWPVEGGRIRRMTPFLAFLQLVIRKSTKIPMTPLALVVDAEWSTREREMVAKMLFERCQVEGLTMLDDALCGLLAHGKTEGVVVNVGHDKTEIATYSDSLLQSRILLPLGSTTISRHLHALLPHLSREQIEALKESPIAEIPIASRTGDTEELDMAKILARGKQKEVVDGASGKVQPNVLLEQNTFSYAGESITVGRERLHVGEVLLHDIATAYGLAVSKIDVDRREYVRENLVVIGGGAKIRGWREALLSTLLATFASANGPSHAPSSTMPSRFPTPSATGTSTPVPLPQPSYSVGSGIRLLKLPDYFVEWKDAPPEDAAFLGAQICARVVFVTDAGSRGYLAREEYSDRGPRAISTVS